MNVLLNRIDVARFFEVQNHQNQECIYLADTVGALAQKLGKASVSNLGHFFVRHMTVSFTTIETVGGVATDTGIDYLRGKLIDGSNMRPLFNDYIPFSLWSTPGRRKSIVASGSDSFQMQIIFPFEYLFTMNSDILIDVKNDSTLQRNSYSVAFWGVRIKSSASTSNL